MSGIIITVPTWLLLLVALSLLVGMVGLYVAIVRELREEATEASREIEAMRLICAVFPSRLQAFFHDGAGKLWAHSETGVYGWAGDRCDDVWLRINRFRAWWHLRRGTNPAVSPVPQPEEPPT